MAPTRLIQRVVRKRLVLDYEGPWTTRHCPSIDATATTAELGVAFRPAADTVRDTVRWLTGVGPRTPAAH
jgi:hypothetical protein